jgi:hypothetical protein
MEGQGQTGARNLVHGKRTSWKHVHSRNPGLGTRNLPPVSGIQLQGVATQALSRKITKSTRKMKKRTLAIMTEAAAAPRNPKNEAIMAMIRKMNAQMSMRLLLQASTTTSDSPRPPFKSRVLRFERNDHS